MFDDLAVLILNIHGLFLRGDNLALYRYSSYGVFGRDKLLRFFDNG
jgi:hypothetical protein